MVVGDRERRLQLLPLEAVAGAGDGREARVREDLRGAAPVGDRDKAVGGAVDDEGGTRVDPWQTVLTDRFHRI